MKHVWILNHYAQSPDGPGGTRHFSLARHLAEHGWSSDIFAASVEHNTGRQRIMGNDLTNVEMIDGVRFTWVKTPSYVGNGITRQLNMVAYTFNVLKRSVTSDCTKPNAVIGSSVHPLAAWAGQRLARRHKVPFIFEIRDLWPQTLIDMGRIADNGILARLLRKLEKWLCDRAAIVVVLLPKAHEYLEAQGVARNKVIHIPNGVELSDYPAPNPPDRTRPFTLMYFGAHGGANGLDNLLSAMSLLRDQPILLRLVGDGPMKAELVKRAEKVGLDKVIFEDPVPKNEIRNVAAEANAFVFNLIDSPVFKFGISSNKLFDFMAARRPVLFACNTTNNIIEDSGGGLTVPPDDPKALAGAVMKLANAIDATLDEMGDAGRSYVENSHSYELLAKRLATSLEAITTQELA